MSITSAIARFKTGAYDVSRPAGGSRVNGAWVEGSPTATTGVTMSIQPLAGADLKVVPQGASAEDFRLVLTTFGLRVRDVVTYKGAPWVVYRAQDWDKRGVTWTRAYISRAAVTPP